MEHRHSAHCDLYRRRPYARKRGVSVSKLRQMEAESYTPRMDDDATGVILYCHEYAWEWQSKIERIENHWINAPLEIDEDGYVKLYDMDCREVLSGQLSNQSRFDSAIGFALGDWLLAGKPLPEATAPKNDDDEDDEVIN